MKIFLDKKKGKKHVLIERMEPWWNMWGHTIQWTPDGADVQLCMITIETKTDLPKVLRLDGVYYGNNTGRNGPLSKAHAQCEGIIYQSIWCKKQAEKFLLPIREDALSRVIYNGIQPIPEAYLDGSELDEKINIFTASRWRRWKRLREVTKVFKTALRHTDLPLFLHVLGDPYDFKKPKSSSIIFYDKISREEMYGYYLFGKVFVHLSKNDWCPNSVIEALSFGMPILASSAGGGTVELMNLVGDQAGLLIDEGGPSCDHDPYDENWNSMTQEQLENGAQKLIQLCESDCKPSFPQELRIETTAMKYIEMFKKVI